MRHRQADTRVVELAREPDYSTHLVGEIAKIDEDGRASVVFPGNWVLPTPARTLVAAPSSSDEGAPAALGAAVLLLFENGEPERPIIVGILRDNLRSERSQPVATPLNAMPDIDQARPNRLVLSADEEIQLRCGESSVVLRRDGKVLIRGSHLVSRSSGPNRIKGGHVSLN